jgi:hypothetical protein
MDTTLADRLIGILSARPDLHDQSHWVGTSWNGDNNLNLKVEPRELISQLDSEESCGTTACLAGWITALTCDDGYVLTPSFIIRPTNRYYTSYASYASYARFKLGITTGQASVLFYLCNTTEEVISCLKYLKDHPDAEVPELRSELWP